MTPPLTFGGRTWNQPEPPKKSLDTQRRKKQRLVRWEQQGDPGQETAINHVPQLPPIVELDERPTLEELTKAIDQLKSRKAAGVDGIPPEIWNYCH